MHPLVAERREQFLAAATAPIVLLDIPLLLEVGAQVDAVVVATPNRFHVEPTLAALKAGCHVLCEKPLATSGADAKSMCEAAREARDALAIPEPQALLGRRERDHARAEAEAAVEETFVNDNARATLKLGQARGMALLAPAMKGLRVAEYPPNLIKKSVVGAGHAEKKQIQMMVGMLLPKAKFANADEADALAIAICHANHRSSPQAKALRMQATGNGQRATGG